VRAALRATPTYLVLAAATTDTSRGKFDVKVAADAVVTAENNFGGVAEAASVACRAITNPPQHNSIMISSSSDDGNLLTCKVDVLIIVCCRTHKCSAQKV
jgi:hypothetical protein